jgi:hypothetical protein
MSLGMSVESGANPGNPPKAKLELSEANRFSAAHFGSEASSPLVFAHGVEFVTLPGESEKLQREIPLVIRDANGESDGFLGCIVLFSEQEARLVTVITLWTGRDRAKQCNEKRLKGLLEPYVDCWLRARSFVTFLSGS